MTTDDVRCQHHSKAGRRCLDPVSASHPELCTYHARRQHAADVSNGQSAHSPENRPPKDTEAVAAELLKGVEDLQSPATVNLFLGNLLRQVAHNRVSRRNAVALAYISQLLLHSISVMQRAARDAQGAEAHRNEHRRRASPVPRLSQF